MKKVRILILSIICIAILAGIAILIVNENYNINQSKIDKKAQEEKMQEGQSLEAVSLKIDIKQETDESYKCLLTFTANSEDNKIKSIEYPAEEGKEPQIIQVEDENGREKIGIDYELSKDKVDKSFTITTLKENKISKRTGYTIDYEPNGGKVEYSKQTRLKNLDTDLIEATKDGYFFLGWSLTPENGSPEYKYYLNQKTYKYKKENGDDIKLYAKWISYDELASITVNDSLIANIERINTSGISTTIANNVTYSLNTIYYDGDLVLDGITGVSGSTLQNNIYEFGDKEKDVAKVNADGTITDAQNMVILKVNGNLTINKGITITACKSDNGYGGPKGFLVYCTGTLTNNGTIDMTARGARAQGENVYLWKNINNNSYEYVPADGANGGDEITLYANSGSKSGNQGISGINRATGGGGSGSIHIGSKTKHAGGGSKGTSYSGGTGGGGAGGLNVATNGKNGEDNGKAGGAGEGRYSSSAYVFFSAGGGSGNPGGLGNGDTGKNGGNGTGGLLIIYKFKWNKWRKWSCSRRKFWCRIYKYIL